jgi:acetyltransferase-like isoleucine patch superfamily enzyme
MHGARIGSNCNIGEHVFVETGAVIGDGVVIKNQVSVWEGIIIEDGAFIGPGVIFTNDHYPRSRGLAAVDSIVRRYEKASNWLSGSLIRSGASLGAGAVIGPGIEIGAYAMVGAGAIVTHSVPAHALMLGAPARIAGWVCLCGRPLDRNSDEEYSCPACARDYVLVNRQLSEAHN